MGRNANKKVLRIRYKVKNGTRCRLVLANNHKSAKSFVGGRVLKIGKVSLEELFHVGEYNNLPEKLMKEFREIQSTPT